jgi:hypothetical protein
MAGSIKLYGPSGYTEIAADASADDNVLTLPSTGTTLATDLDLATKLNIAGGKILQIVRATDSTERSTTSTSYVDVTGMSVTITPSKSDSIILVLAVFTAAPFSSTTSLVFGAVRITDSSNNALSGAQATAAGVSTYNYTGTGFVFTPVTMVGHVAPNTTSAVTYKLRFQVQDAGTTLRLLNASNTGQLYAIEVSA